MKTPMTDDELTTERARVKARFRDVLTTLRTREHMGRSQITTPIGLSVRAQVKLGACAPFDPRGGEVVDDLDEAQLKVLDDAITAHFGVSCPPTKQTTAA